MKKYLILAVALAGVMSSCSKEDVVSTESNQASNMIGFAPYSNLNTRGTAYNGTDAFNTAGNTFGVTAFISSGTSAYLGRMDGGAQIVYGSGVWDYASTSDSRYWPTNLETLDFFAYSPFAGTNRSTPTITMSKTDGMKFATYKVPEAIASQEDFMYASINAMSKPETGSTVTLPFKHALTQVKFAAATLADNLFVEINGITINNLQSTADFTLPAGVSTVVTEDDGTDQNFILTTETGAGWTFPTDGVYADYAATVNSPVEIAYVGTGTTTYTTITDATDVLMLLPQAFTPWATGGLQDGTFAVTNSTADADDANETYITISCAIYTYGYNDSGDLDKTNKIYLLGSSDGTYGTIYFPLTDGDDSEDDKTLWEQGKIVTYNLLFDTAGYTDPDEDEEDEEDEVQTLIKISFDVTAENWLDTTGIPVIL